MFLPLFLVYFDAHTARCDHEISPDSLIDTQHSTLIHPNISEQKPSKRQTDYQVIISYIFLSFQEVIYTSIPPNRTAVIICGKINAHRPKVCRPIDRRLFI